MLSLLSSMDKKKLEHLLKQSTKILYEEPNYQVLDSDKPIVFVGDTHGDFRTSEQILSKYKNSHKIVFLGDYVDRATEPEGSLKNITGILEAKLKNDIIMLRGNHEFKTVWKNYGFNGELFPKYYEFEDAFEELASNMPYAVGTENGLLGLHGGIPDISSIEELIQLPKGVKRLEENPLICQLVWNDNLLSGPTGSHKSGITKSDRDFKREWAFMYGDPYFSKKLKLLKKKVLVRGHDYRIKGYSMNDRILTLFSSESYSNRGLLKGRYITILDPQKNLKTAKDLDLIKLD